MFFMKRCPTSRESTYEYYERTMLSGLVLQTKLQRSAEERRGVYAYLYCSSRFFVGLTLLAIRQNLVIRIT